MIQVQDEQKYNCLSIDYIQKFLLEKIIKQLKQNNPDDTHIYNEDKNFNFPKNLFLNLSIFTTKKLLEETCILHKLIKLFNNELNNIEVEENENLLRIKAKYNHHQEFGHVNISFKTYTVFNIFLLDQIFNISNFVEENKNLLTSYTHGLCLMDLMEDNIFNLNKLSYILENTCIIKAKENKEKRLKLNKKIHFFHLFRNFTNEEFSFAKDYLNNLKERFDIKSMSYKGELEYQTDFHFYSKMNYNHIYHNAIEDYNNQMITVYFNNNIDFLEFPEINFVEFSEFINIFFSGVEEFFYDEKKNDKVKENNFIHSKIENYGIEYNNHNEDKDLNIKDYLVSDISQIQVPSWVRFFISLENLYRSLYLLKYLINSIRLIISKALIKIHKVPIEANNLEDLKSIKSLEEFFKCLLDIEDQLEFIDIYRITTTLIESGLNSKLEILHEPNIRAIQNIFFDNIYRIFSILKKNFKSIDSEFFNKLIFSLRESQSKKKIFIKQVLDVISELFQKIGLKIPLVKTQKLLKIKHLNFDYFLHEDFIRKLEEENKSSYYVHLNKNIYSILSDKNKILNECKEKTKDIFYYFLNNIPTIMKNKKNYQKTVFKMEDYWKLEYNIDFRILCNNLENYGKNTEFKNKIKLNEIIKNDFIDKKHLIKKLNKPIEKNIIDQNNLVEIVTKDENLIEFLKKKRNLSDDNMIIKKRNAFENDINSFPESIHEKREKIERIKFMNSFFKSENRRSLDLTTYCINSIYKKNNNP